MNWNVNFWTEVWLGEVVSVIKKNIESLWHGLEAKYAIVDVFDIDRIASGCNVYS